MAFEFSNGFSTALQTASAPQTAFQMASTLPPKQLFKCLPVLKWLPKRLFKPFRVIKRLSKWLPHGCPNGFSNDFKRLNSLSRSFQMARVYCQTAFRIPWKFQMAFGESFLMAFQTAPFLKWLRPGPKRLGWSGLQRAQKASNGSERIFTEP